LVGVAVVFVLSQLRVLGLFYAHHAGPQWFDAVHGVVAPLATLAGALAFFLWWLSVRKGELQASTP
jgi:exosortase/archaeosortase family protein